MIPIVLLIIFIVTIGITFYRIHVGFSLIVAMQMIIPPNVRISLGPVDFQLHNMLIIMLSLRFILYLSEHKKQFTSYRNLFLKPFYILFLGLFLLTFFAPTLDILTHLKNLFFTFNNGFVLSIIAFFIFHEIKQIETFIKIVVISTIAITLYGVFCYVTLSNPYIKSLGIIFPGMDALSFMEEARGGLKGRIQGTLLHPLIWGGLCLLLFFFLRPQIKNGFLKGITTFLLFLNVVFSGSRSALIALICGFIYFFVYSGFQIKRKYLLYASVLITVIITAIYQVPSLKKYSAYFEATVFFWDDDKAKDSDFRGSDIATRTMQLAGSFDMIDNSLFVGLGQGYIQYYQEKYGQHPLLLGFDSMVFITLITSGLVGFSLWLFFFYKLYSNTKIVYRQTEHRNKNDFTELRSLIIVYFVFIVLTGFQNVFSHFLVFYAIQLKKLIIS